MLAQKKLPKWLRNICKIKKCVFNDFGKKSHIIKITASKKIYKYIFVYVFLYIYIYIYIYIYKLICIITVEQTN